MKTSLLVLTVLLSLSMPGRAQTSPVFKTADGAIRGYDPVAYFDQKKPVKGLETFKYSWNGADWYFANQQHLDQFKANPAHYAPQYGGYCAYGLADGHKAPTDPQAWTILQDKLYLNYNQEVKVMWTKDQPGYIIKADKNWPSIKDK